ncbi:DoxX family protein [Pseudoalteromonas denitrificans]|uniref:DoxX protein n=1 Tax=Pseudoalteromonas denitrificans DSM 6059 TaxID=1123010 RepID=A0A1I1NT22_9GAMM|nr:DoxX family protein [Pseudoalteromonas denitrificans]SFD00769.1 DoxX protein [Pseudoalteromonas denitrificans DSM 6059]
MLQKVIHFYHTSVDKSQIASGLAPLLFRLILAPVMIIAGYNKLGISAPWDGAINAVLADPNVVAWFGNTQWGLGLPFPDLLAFLAGWTEFLGGWFLLIGLFTRITVIPLMFTMLIAATTVHWDNGWFAVTPTNPNTSAAKVLDWLSIPGAKDSLQNSIEAKKRLDKIKEIIEVNGFPDYLYEKGKPVILNNGIEFSVTYFVMLLSLFFSGGGRITSMDYWLTRSGTKK